MREEHNFVDDPGAGEAAQEVLERPLLEGRWVSSIEAINLVGQEIGKERAEDYLLSVGSKIKDNRQLVRIKARFSQAKVNGVLQPAKRHRIVHTFEWDADVIVSFWPSGYFELRHRRWTERLLMLDGIEFSLDDLESLIRSAKNNELKTVPLAGETINAVQVAARTTPWSDGKMKAEIAACAYSNREKAWRADFSKRVLEHGWSNDAFRSIWSEARKTKGMTGRPPRKTESRQG